MTHWAKMVADSVSRDGVRLSTIEVQMPRIVLAEFNTHRMFSRNSASSRAIPVARMIAMVTDDPYIPTEWGVNRPGMQATELLSAGNTVDAECAWLRARDNAVKEAETLLRFGVHKQLANRLLEPFMWHTVVVTATEWDNFFHLRRHPDAHPEIRKAADCMWEVMQRSTPVELGYGEWHMPYVMRDDLLDPRLLYSCDIESEDPAVIAASEAALLAHAANLPVRPTAERQLLLRQISTARCARVSFLTHDGVRNITKDGRLHAQLLGKGHMSPFEHVARPGTNADLTDPDLTLVHTPDASVGEMFWGNFRGWVQYRKLVPHEHDILGVRVGSKESLDVVEEDLATRVKKAPQCDVCGHSVLLHDPHVRAQAPNPWLCPCCVAGVVG